MRTKDKYNKFGKFSKGEKFGRRVHLRKIWLKLQAGKSRKKDGKAIKVGKERKNNGKVGKSKESKKSRENTGKSGEKQQNHEKAESIGNPAQRNSFPNLSLRMHGPRRLAHEATSSIKLCNSILFTSFGNAIIQI